MSVDLFKVIVDEDKLHPLFVQVLKDSACAKIHPIINSWGEGLLGRSGEALKFIKEFQTTFSSSFWELYLNQAFKELGYEVDYSKASPDFNLVGANNRFISVEAVTTNPQNVIELAESNLPGEGFLNESTLKLSGKIRDKHKLYIGDGKKKHPYCSLEHVKGHPFVLALSPFDRILSQGQNNTAINMVLYGIEPPEKNSWTQAIVESIPNKNGQRVDLGIFTNDSYKEISAVIFSTTGTFGKVVAKAGTASFIRATWLRKLSITDFMANEGSKKLGTHVNKYSEDSVLVTWRVFDGRNVCGYDMYVCDSAGHSESHLDGLQVYHNPYALHPLAHEDFESSEVVQYHYDIENEEMSISYKDRALVSRNTFSTIG